jgi:hypothetical protein
MVSLFGRGKVISYELQKREGHSFQSVASYDPKDWGGRVPGQEELADEFEDGVGYRLVGRFPNGSMTVYWTVPGKRGSGKKARGSEEVRKMIEESVGPAIAVVEAIGETYQKLRGAMFSTSPMSGGEAGEEGEVGGGEDWVTQIKNRFTETAQLARALDEFRGYDPSRPNFPALQFSGQAPWMMHPWILNYTKEFVQDVLTSMADAAQNFGYKFRQGLTGKVPQQPQQSQPATIDPSLFPDEGEELGSVMERLEREGSKLQPDDTEGGEDRSSAPAEARVTKS